MWNNFYWVRKKELWVEATRFKGGMASIAGEGFRCLFAFSPESIIKYICYKLFMPGCTFFFHSSFERARGRKCRARPEISGRLSNFRYSSHHRHTFFYELTLTSTYISFTFGPLLPLITHCIFGMLPINKHHVQIYQRGVFVCCATRSHSGGKRFIISFAGNKRIRLDNLIRRSRGWCDGNISCASPGTRQNIIHHHA